ncbi:MAG: bifunctional 5,10-methylenetetrahydrofolate dehydrogenase/5,10-methenyltetrahydrofolate cyclohydrolase, partial [Anaerococcus hydrogenalis]|nr:bifunctional 5,10-methylenetetrahydrofolate dehydrogenase/5,10-methenyltetrahydrofolate cyclohydrolase [Anaerococcus hydrogenalis]
IIIANSTNVIGKPLAMYLNYKKATVTLFNSKTINQKEKIKNSDIFISAIGKANFYNSDFFKDGQIIIDAGTSFVDGKMYGDIDYDSIKNLDIKVVTCRNGVGSITTLSLLESLLSN